MPNTLRDAYKQTGSMTLGVLRYHLTNVLNNGAFWGWVTIIVFTVSTVVDAEATGRVLPIIALMLIAYAAFKVYARLRMWRMKRKRNNVRRITISVSL